MSLLKLLIGSAAPATIYVDDVFSAATWAGNSSSQAINIGFDLTTDTAVTWFKDRTNADGAGIVNTVLGNTKRLVSYATDASSNASSYFEFTSTGYNFPSATVNTTGSNYVGWTFKDAPKFHKTTTVVKSGGSNATVSFADLEVLGMVRVKRTDSTGSWYIWHRSLTAGKLLIGETTAAEATLGHITVSGTTVTLVNGVIADGTYLVEGFAHDTDATGIIQCGTFTPNGGGNATITLGWEPQFLITKDIGQADVWQIVDTSRQFCASINASTLKANAADAESVAGYVCNVNATGFGSTGGGFSPSSPVVYLAIRRPNKPPTVGTQVYNAIARTGTGAAATVTGVGFAPDLILGKERGSTGAPNFTDRLRGATYEILSSGAAAEATLVNDLTAFGMDGFTLGSGASGQKNTNTSTYIEECFRRYPGVFDQVCYTGTGSAHTEAHNLGVVPELMIVKGRDNAGSAGTLLWRVYHSGSGPTKHGDLAGFAGFATSSTNWNNTAPTASVFTVGTALVTNGSGNGHVAYLFATLTGISFVGEYTGDGGAADSAGTSKTINCGFSAGARFVLIKCKDANETDWVIVDTVRGIVAGNDPALSLNSTAAEVTTTDLLDSDSSGFVVNQLAAGTTSANFNVTGRTYLVLAIA